jgi:hypothetical protein
MALAYVLVHHHPDISETTVAGTDMSGAMATALHHVRADEHAGHMLNAHLRALTNITELDDFWGTVEVGTSSDEDL